MGSGNAFAGLLVLTGDNTPIFSLTDIAPNSVDSGNTAFYANALGGGTQVAILETTNSTLATAELSSFYGSRPGVTATLLSGTLTAASLAGVHLLVLTIPDRTFTAAEAAVIQQYMTAGGSLFVMGEHGGTAAFVATNNSINQLLVALGSGLSLTTVSGLDIGNQQATGSRIANTPLTAGVASLAYGATSIVNGGTPLFFTTTSQVFAAYEGSLAPVPEPSTLLLFAAGAAAVLLRRR